MDLITTRLASTSRTHQMQIEGSSVIVTGGASGLGAATTKMLLENGAKVAIFDVEEEKGAAFASASGATFIRSSVYDEAEVAAGFDVVEATNGTANILINCAGVAPYVRIIRPLENTYPIEVAVRTINVNLIGTILMSARFAERLKGSEFEREERGVIVHTASIAAFDGQVGHVAYAASKAGVVGLTLPMARDLASHRIRVMCIAPGIFDTPMLEGVPNGNHVELCSQVPHPNRIGKPSEFALMVKDIISNPMLNGEVIRLDGALRLAPY